MTIPEHLRDRVQQVAQRARSVREGWPDLTDDEWIAAALDIGLRVYEEHLERDQERLCRVYVQQREEHDGAAAR